MAVTMAINGADTLAKCVDKRADDNADSIFFPYLTKN
jgi:hypothetical protein